MTDRELVNAVKELARGESWQVSFNHRDFGSGEGVVTQVTVFKPGCNAGLFWGSDAKVLWQTHEHTTNAAAYEAILELVTAPEAPND